MSIKRMIATILCVVMACFVLSGCQEDGIGGFHYDWEPDVVVKLEFDLYIIAESTTEASKAAQNTVESKINQYLDEEFDVILDINYLAAEDYDAAISELVANISTTARTVEKAADRQYGGAIILIKGKDMHDSLVSSNALVDLKSYLDTSRFGTLNRQITRNVLDAASVVDAEDVTHLYCIPNDHIVGEYKYVVINRSIAEGYLNFSAQSELLEMNFVEGAWNETAQRLIDSIDKNLPDTQLDDVIKVVSGKYSDKAEWEKQGYICNVAEYPVVDAEEALQASFGIVKSSDIYVGNSLLISDDNIHARAMDVIYSINANKTIRNLLQYGLENTHYRLVNVNGYNYAEILESSDYKMNLLYTGDAFNALYSGEWTHDVALSGEKQNEQSTLAGK